MHTKTIATFEPTNADGHRASVDEIYVPIVRSWRVRIEAREGAIPRPGAVIETGTGDDKTRDLALWIARLAADGMIVVETLPRSCDVCDRPLSRVEREEGDTVCGACAANAGPHGASTTAPTDDGERWCPVCHDSYNIAAGCVCGRNDADAKCQNCGATLASADLDHYEALLAEVGVVGEGPKVLCAACRSEASRDYPVLVADYAANEERTETYRATSYAEALAMAERALAGKSDATVAIPRAMFETARAEGLRFNEADGILLD